MATTKIATCCYCGTRAALVLRGKERHELSCGNCGAPLHALKMLPTSLAPAAATADPKPKKHAKKRNSRPTYRPKKRRKNKSIGRKVFAEIWDVIEDVFD